MDTPKLTDKCSTIICQHPFSDHYQTYDEKKTGCSHVNDNQRDSGICFCAGFTRVYKYVVEATSQSFGHTPSLLSPHPPGARRANPEDTQFG